MNNIKYDIWSSSMLSFLKFMNNKVANDVFENILKSKKINA